MADQFKNLMIGLFVTAAAAIIIFVLMFLHPRIGDDGKILYARFTDIDKVTIGTRVTYGGKPVGEVIEIKEVDKERRGRADSAGQIYLYELTLRVDSGVNIFNTDEVSLRTSGLLGEKNVEITPIAPEREQILREIDPKQPIYAIETTTVEDAFKEIREVANKFDKALDSITEIVNNARNQQIVEKIARTIENLESITGSLNNPQQWSETLANIHRLSERINVTWDSVDPAIKSFDIAMKHLDEASVSFTTVGTGISEGRGTFGKLINDEEFYLRINSVLSKLETTFDDINHYGLLFHSDKGWQRLRARRLNLMQKLRTPQEFHNYFNDEIDQISTSLARVSMVLNNVNADPFCCDLLQNREYTKVFADLMRRISMLEEEVRMYNTQVVEVKVHETELGSPPLCEECFESCECSQ